MSPFAPQKCVNEAHFRGAKGDNDKITARSAVLHWDATLGCDYALAESSAASSLLRGGTPWNRSTTSPPLNSNKVGIALIPYFWARSGCSSTLTLPTTTLPLYLMASSSMTGAICRHGPHHVAQKSTRTGVAAPKTSTGFHG